MTDQPDQLILIAGNGAYPRQLARCAKEQGVSRVFAIAFPGETDKRINNCADDVVWLKLGQLQRMLDAMSESGISHAVMAGQITPTALFRVRPDKLAINMLTSLRERNAHTIFGAIADKFKAIGVELLPAHLFMESAMAPEGPITANVPSSEQDADIQLGLRAAKITSDLDIGQTVVIKDGTIVAVEAFEGTNETIKRAGKLCGDGAIVVKVAKPGHDMRFDIPVIGTATIKQLKKIKASALALEAGKTIILEKDKVVKVAGAAGICIVGV